MTQTVVGQVKLIYWPNVIITSFAFSREPVPMPENRGVLSQSEETLLETFNN